MKPSTAMKRFRAAIVVGVRSLVAMGSVVGIGSIAGMLGTSAVDAKAVAATGADPAAPPDTLVELDAAFWQWRAAEQPFTADDIPRIERPPDFVVDWSRTAIARRRADLERFEARWRRIARGKDRPITERVDDRLLASALARVRWELNIDAAWRRDPTFYVFQSLGSVYALLLPPPPFSAQRQREIVARLSRIPATLAAARANLDDMRRPYAELAVEALDHIADRWQNAQAALAGEFAPAEFASMTAAAPAAIAALEAYRGWLANQMPHARADTAVGRASYEYFLHDVALMPFTAEALLAMSRQEWARSMAFEAEAERRAAALPAQPLFVDAAAEVAAEGVAENAIRAFIASHRILTVPAWMPHYRNLPLPAYLAPFADLGETDDFGGPTHPGADGTSYIPIPDPKLGFFNLSRARDPRPIIVHEGIPGHFFQLSLGWHHPDPIRRHYYDSGANEGIGFYAEEMMLQAGLFDDDARTRATIYGFMRLRALRVEVDVKLALGAFTLAEGAAYLERMVPMDAASARAEAALFASTPGQAISYQIGKIQLTELLADARRAAGAKFSLQDFNDYVWNNGNVPLSLQRWELLGDESALPQATPAPPARSVGLVKNPQAGGSR